MFSLLSESDRYFENITFASLKPLTEKQRIITHAQQHVLVFHNNPNNIDRWNINDAKRKNVRAKGNNINLAT